MVRPWYVRGTSVVRPWYVRSTSVWHTEVLRRYYGGTTEVPYSQAPDTRDGSRTGGSTCDGQPKIGSVNATTETGQGRDGGVVRGLVLQPGTLATGSLTARELGNGSGRGVGQTSGRTVGRASGPEFPQSRDPFPGQLRREMPDGGAFLPRLLTPEGGAGWEAEACLV